MKKISIAVILVGAVLLLTACSTAVVPQSTAVQVEQALPTDPPVATDTPVPPPPTQEPGKVLLVASAVNDLEIYHPLLEKMSASAGLLFESKPELEAADLTKDIRIVVFLAPPANLNELSAAAPTTQFAVVSAGGLPGAANVSIIRQQTEYQAFVGGFISVLLSTDWRVGGLLPIDGPLGESIQEAYVNGGRYFCGMCAAGWPLGIYYPQAVLLPAGSDGEAYRAAAAGLFDTQKVEAYYLSAQAARPEVFEYVQGKDQFGKTVLLVGEQAPPEEVRPQWAATVRFDLVSGIEQLWPDLLAGKGGAEVDAVLVLEDINLANLGEGRLRLVQELMAEIEAGAVLPFSVPQE
jgi:hypothetical protein